MRRTHVLIIDDDDLSLELIRAAFERIGILDVATSLDAASGLAALDRAAPDLLLLDLNMPEMDGIELLRHLAARRYPGGIALISGEDHTILQTAQALARAHGLDVVGALDKPIAPEALRRLLDARERGRATPRSRRVTGPHVTVDDLRAALAGGQLTAHFQPKVAIPRGEPVGVEALVRWTHPVLGAIPPVAFIPLAEQEGLINDLTRIVLEVSLREAARWLALGHRLGVAVNISAESTEALDLPEYVVARAREHGVEPSAVTLEMTETQLIRNLARTLDTLTRLRLRRIRLSIDDFGTGFSSLEQLRRIPFVELKIDRAFVDGAASDPGARTLLESTLELGHKLGLTVVAEGIEREDDLALLRELGCDVAQGFLLARPMSSDQLIAWLANDRLARTLA